MDTETNRRLKEGLIKKIKKSCVDNINYFIDTAELQYQQGELNIDDAMGKYFCRVNQCIIYAFSTFSPKFIQNIKKILKDTIDSNMIHLQLEIDAGALLNLCYCAITGEFCNSSEISEMRNFQLNIMHEAIKVKSQEISTSVDNHKKEDAKNKFILEKAPNMYMELPSVSYLQKYLESEEKYDSNEDYFLNSFLDSVFSEIVDLFEQETSLSFFHLPVDKNIAQYLKYNYVSAGMCAILFLSTIRDSRIDIWFKNKSYTHSDIINGLIKATYNKIHEQSYLFLKPTEPNNLPNVVTAVSYSVAHLSDVSNTKALEDLTVALIQFYLREMFRFYDEDILHKIR